ncbi:unnamed protein product, partial [Brassica napus]
IVNTAGLCRLVLTKNNQVFGLQLRSNQNTFAYTDQLEEKRFSRGDLWLGW